MEKEKVIFRLEINDKRYQRKLNRVKKITYKIQSGINCLASMGIKINTEVDYSEFYKNFQDNMKVKTYKNKTVYVL